VKVVVTGAAGMLGRAVVRHGNTRGDQVVAMDRAALDITDGSGIQQAFDRERPDVVINCAAWTDVDNCELDANRAHLTNALGPELLAKACRPHDATFITISTDYVFDGSKQGFYTQRDQPNPRNIYGTAKLEGEHRATIAWAKTIVVRSGYIFGVGGKNFLSTCVSRLSRGERLRVINDMWGTPTYAEDLAARLYELAKLDLPGIYHVTNSGEGASFADFAQTAAIEAGLDSSLLTTTSLESLGLPAPRPRNSRLKCILSDAIGLRPLRSWRAAVADFAGGSVREPMALA
jgi:dTDP-4-dehydrorhamnose reductase